MIVEISREFREQECLTWDQIYASCLSAQCFTAISNKRADHCPICCYGAQRLVTPQMHSSESKMCPKTRIEMGQCVEQYLLSDCAAACKNSREHFGEDLVLQLTLKNLVLESAPFCVTFHRAKRTSFARVSQKLSPGQTRKRFSIPKPGPKSCVDSGLVHSLTRPPIFVVMARNPLDLAWIYLLEHHYRQFLGSCPGFKIHKSTPLSGGLRAACYLFDTVENADMGTMAVLGYNYNSIAANFFNQPLPLLGVQIMSICNNW